MNPDLERDLERWERGEITRSTLIATHGAEARELVEVFEQLEAASLEPVAFDEAGWDALSARLPARKGRRPVLRVLALAAATVLLLASVAYGTIDPVRETVDDLIGRRSGQPPSPSVSINPTPMPTPTPSRDDGSDDNSGPGSDDSSGPGSGDDDKSSSGSDDKSGSDDNSGSGSGSDDSSSSGSGSGSGSDDKSGSGSDDKSGSGSDLDGRSGSDDRGDD